jgi:hypothetical protein
LTIPFYLSFPVSILAGFVGAMSGMGGGVVLIPALTILGALAGAAITLAVSPRPLYLAFGGVLLASWLALLAAGHQPWQSPKTQDAFSRWLELEGSYPDQVLGETIYYKARRAYFGAPLMFGAGVIAGLLGIGAGAVKVLIHDLVMGLPPKVSTTTSNLIIGVTALAGSSVYLAAGLIDPGLAAPVILGVVIGALLGTRLLVRLSNRSVRNFFLVVLIVLAVQMIVRGIRS